MIARAVALPTVAASDFLHARIRLEGLTLLNADSGKEPQGLRIEGGGGFFLDDRTN